MVLQTLRNKTNCSVTRNPKVIWEKQQSPHWLQWDVPHLPQNAPSPSVIITPSNTTILNWPHSAVFPQITPWTVRPTNQQTDTQTNSLIATLYYLHTATTTMTVKYCNDSVTSVLRLFARNYDYRIRQVQHSNGWWRFCITVQWDEQQQQQQMVSLQYLLVHFNCSFFANTKLSWLIIVFKKKLSMRKMDRQMDG